MSKKRKRIFLNAIKVFRGMSGQKIKIGNQTFDAPFQGNVDSSKSKNSKSFTVYVGGSITAGGAVLSLNCALLTLILDTPAYLKSIYFHGISSIAGSASVPVYSILTVLGAEGNFLRPPRAIIGAQGSYSSAFQLASNQNGFGFYDWSQSGIYFKSLTNYTVSLIGHKSFALNEVLGCRVLMAFEYA